MAPWAGVATATKQCAHDLGALTKIEVARTRHLSELCIVPLPGRTADISRRSHADAVYVSATGTRGGFEISPGDGSPYRSPNSLAATLHHYPSYGRLHGEAARCAFTCKVGLFGHAALAPRRRPKFSKIGDYGEHHARRHAPPRPIHAPAATCAPAATRAHRAVATVGAASMTSCLPDQVRTRSRES